MVSYTFNNHMKLKLYLSCRLTFAMQVKKRCFDVKQALNILFLLNDGGDIRNMLEDGEDFDFRQFKGRLDVESAAIIGHSFGGGTTVQVICDEPRFK